MNTTDPYETSVTYVLSIVGKKTAGLKTRRNARWRTYRIISLTRFFGYMRTIQRFLTLLREIQMSKYGLHVLATAHKWRIDRKGSSRGGSLHLRSARRSPKLKTKAPKLHTRLIIQSYHTMRINGVPSQDTNLECESGNGTGSSVVRQHRIHGLPTCSPDIYINYWPRGTGKTETITHFIAASFAHHDEHHQAPIPMETERRRWNGSTTWRVQEINLLYGRRIPVRALENIACRPDQ